MQFMGRQCQELQKCNVVIFDKQSYENSTAGPWPRFTKRKKRNVKLSIYQIIYSFLINGAADLTRQAGFPFYTFSNPSRIDGPLRLLSLLQCHIIPY